MSALDAIELQVVTGALRAACEEMGGALIRSAHSSNIKERRDASTALFDADAQMVMQAEHIPVHLGSMPVAVEAVRDRRHSPGVSWILNDPFAGGTHLPDITVITPVFAAADQRGRHALLGFAASRAHHADVGGRVPGSMPADSHTLAEEGVVISPRVLDDEAIEELAARMRQPDQRRADLRAQLAANRVGARRLSALAEHLGRERLRAATDAVLDYAERRTRACIAALDDGERLAEDVLEAPEGDLRLRLRARVEGSGSCSTSRAAPRNTAATSTARSPSPAPPACSPYACSPTPTYRPRPAHTGPSTCALPPGRSSTRERRRRRGSRQRGDLLARGRPRARRVRMRTRAGHDEQPHPRRRPLAGRGIAGPGSRRSPRARSPTTRRSAAARAPVPTPTAPAGCTWR